MHEVGENKFQLYRCQEVFKGGPKSTCSVIMFIGCQYAWITAPFYKNLQIQTLQTHLDRVRDWTKPSFLFLCKNVQYTPIPN